MSFWMPLDFFFSYKDESLDLTRVRENNVSSRRQAVKNNLGQTPSVWLLLVSGMSCAYSKELDKGKHFMGHTVLKPHPNQSTSI